MSKIATFSKLHYLHYSRNTDVYNTLKKDRARLQKMTGVYVTEGCILNRAALICPLCECTLQVRHGAGLDSLIRHLRTSLHSDDPLAKNFVRSWQDDETPYLDNYEKKRLSKDYSKDHGYCKLSVVEDLMRGDRTSLSIQPGQSKSDRIQNCSKNML